MSGEGWTFNDMLFDQCGLQTERERAEDEAHNGANLVICDALTMRAYRKGFEDGKQFERQNRLPVECIDLFSTVLCLARLKWGNLDKDANKVFESAELAIKKAKGGAE